MKTVLRLPFVALVVLVGGVAIYLLSIWLATINKDTSVSAWVQAVGALVALAVAVYIPTKAEAQQTAEKRAALQERRKIAREQIAVVSEFVLTEDRFAAGQIKTGVEILTAIDFKDLDHPTAMALSELIMTLGAAEAVIAEATRENPANCGLGERLLKRIEGARDKAVVALDDLLR